VDTITIDDLDRQLAQCLGVDGRASFSQLGDVLGVSDQTVARRYRRLRSAGVLRVVGLKARHKVGYLGWFLRMRCVPGAGPAIAASLARRTDTAWIQLLSGSTEVLCTLRGDGREGREALLAKLPRSDRIVAVTAHSLLHMFTGGPFGLGFLRILPDERVEPLRRPVRGGQADRHVELGELDFALFGALGVDGRAPHPELATVTGWSESAVRRRMEQLRDTGVLYFDLELDMAAFGFRAPTWLWLSVPP
jgi:DNA-binding Lrp family transcriptional regulator